MQTVECEDEFDRRILTQGGNEQVKCGLRESLSFVNPHDISPLDTLDVDGAALTETLEAYGAAGEQTGDGRFGDAPRQRKLGLEVIRINRDVSNNFSNDYRKDKRSMQLRSYFTKPFSPADFEKKIKCDAVVFFPGLREISADTISEFDTKLIFLDVGGFTRKIGEKNKEGLYSLV